MNKTICIQDAVKELRPTRHQAQREIIKLKELIPDKTFTICDGYVGSWRMLSNGSTCFYCPPIYIEIMVVQPDEVER